MQNQRLRQLKRQSALGGNLHLFTVGKELSENAATCACCCADSSSSPAAKDSTEDCPEDATASGIFRSFAIHAHVGLAALCHRGRIHTIWRAVKIDGIKIQRQVLPFCNSATIDGHYPEIDLGTGWDGDGPSAIQDSLFDLSGIEFSSSVFTAIDGGDRTDNDWRAYACRASSRRWSRHQGQSLPPPDGPQGRQTA